MSPRWISACGLLEMSTTHRLSASSRGHSADPKRTIPARFPNALFTHTHTSTVSAPDPAIRKI